MVAEEEEEEEEGYAMHAIIGYLFLASTYKRVLHSYYSNPASSVNAHICTELLYVLAFAC
jgi:hypothetical protein